MLACVCIGKRTGRRNVASRTWLNGCEGGLGLDERKMHDCEDMVGRVLRESGRVVPGFYFSEGTSTWTCFSCIAGIPRRRRRCFAFSLALHSSLNCYILHTASRAKRTTREDWYLILIDLFSVNSQGSRQGCHRGEEGDRLIL